MRLTCTTIVGCAGLALLAALPVTLNARRDPAAAAPLANASPESPALAYRLGTAGRPFGWTTAVGDFNADGRPDVIVADRASGWARNSGYRLDFAISGEAASTDTFQAPDDGIGIRIADVDHDSDLDIVLASTTSGRTIGVWLNDGAGHFTRSPMQVADTAVLTPRSADRGLPGGAVIAIDMPSRRFAAMAPVRVRAPDATAASARLLPAFLPVASRLVSSSAVPRAPPGLL